MNLIHLVEFYPGYDCIHFDCIFSSENCYPFSAGSHGKHGLEIKFIVKGEQGAVQFILYTGWLPQIITKKYSVNWSEGIPIPADLGYHAKTPQYEGQTLTSQSCTLCDGQPCFYDGSGINAQDAMYTLVNGGGTKLWDFLESFYSHVFNGAEYPTVIKYPMLLRNKTE